jgi:hypothetical protein
MSTNQVSKSGKGGTGGKTGLWVAIGCLGCVGLPLVAVAAGAGGWFLASSKYEATIAFDKALEDMDRELREPSTTTASSFKDDGDDDDEIAKAHEREAKVIADLLRAAEETTPTPVAVVKSTPTPTPVVVRSTPTPRATPTPVRVAATPIKTPEVRKPVPTPTAVALSKPAPTSTPRKFESLEIDPKPTTTKVASAANAATAGNDDDVAVASLFGDELPPPSDAPGKIDPKRRIIKTKSGARDVTLGKKIALQGSDKKTVIGTLEKVEGGWVAIRPSDGKVKMIAEADLIDASEL